MKKNLNIVVAALLFAFSTLSFAGVHNQGMYLEGNVGGLYAGANFMGEHYSQFGSFGINGNLGYQLTPNLATEIGYTDYGNSLNNVDAALKVILPFTMNGYDYTVFGKVGPAFMFDGNSSTVVPLFGIGASYSMTQNLDANVQAQGITQGLFSLGLLSVGLTYHFE